MEFETNGSGISRRAKIKRDDKGRYLPGTSGGPGRRKRAELKDIAKVRKELTPEVMKTIKKLLASNDLKLGAKGVELYLKFFGHEKEGVDRAILTPGMVGLLRWQTDRQQEEQEAYDIDG